jgi:serine protease Do
MNQRSFFQGTLIATASLVVGMVIASRLDLTPSSLAGPFNAPAVNSSPLTGPIDATTFRTIAHDASPAVVSISIKATVPAKSLGDIFGFSSPGQGRRGGRMPAPQQLLEGAGSGFIIDKSGLILTNNHVIDEAQEIEVSFADSRTGDRAYPAEVIGHDELSDTALIKLTMLPDHALTEMKFGDSSQMAPGDWVMAIGNPFRLSNSVSVGIVSAVGRAQPASVSARGARFEEMIQTDAAINKGNSGGPLFNMDGEVIGVNTAIISPTGGSIGIGFAVPSDTAVAVVDQLRQFGETRRGWLGVKIQSITDELADTLGVQDNTGALVASVTTDSPAAKAGIQDGDIILKFDGKDVGSMRGLPRIVAQTPIGKEVDVEVLRKGQKMNLRVAVARLVEDEDAAKAASPKEPPKSSKGKNRGKDKDKDSGNKPSNSLIGLVLAPLTDELREKNGLGKDVKGVIVLEVDPGSAAAEKGVKPGDVIVEVAQDAVNSIDDVTKGIDKVKKAGRKAVLLRLESGKGGLRFVAVPVE